MMMKKLLNLLDEYFSERDMTVCKAISGKEGLNKIREEKFDLAILDVMMPGMDGLEVLKIFE